MTSAEAVLINAGGLAGAAFYGITAVRDRMRGSTAARRGRVDVSNRRFVAALGLDPDAVLGPPMPGEQAADEPPPTASPFPITVRSDEQTRPLVGSRI